jgi:hypothetical protein
MGRLLDRSNRRPCSSLLSLSYTPRTTAPCLHPGLGHLLFVHQYSCHVIHNALPITATPLPGSSIGLSARYPTCRAYSMVALYHQILIDGKAQLDNVRSSCVKAGRRMPCSLAPVILPPMNDEDIPLKRSGYLSTVSTLTRSACAVCMLIRLKQIPHLSRSQSADLCDDNDSPEQDSVPTHFCPC